MTSSPTLHLADADPTQLLHTLGVPGSIGVVILALLLISQLVPAIQSLLTAAGRLVGWFAPSLYTKSNRQKLDTRRRIARLLLLNLDLLEQELHWHPWTFADVPVTIEARDTPAAGRRRLFSLRASLVTYRTRSLSKALQRERQHIILVQGPPGSGKSVAMRHFARQVLERAERARRKQQPLAICVSLRDFSVSPDDVTAENLRDYIVAQINVQKASELSAYLATELTADIASGNVLLMLDSFDELPALLGTRKIDAAVLPYVRAISNLMGGGASRCLVASREYKGPRVEGWTRLELIGLSFEEQIKLLKNYGLGEREIQVLEPLLLDPRAGFSADLRNPLTLALLASFVSGHGRAPTRPSELFDDYVARCLSEALPDDDKGIEALVRALASFAFGLVSRTDAGLSGRPEDLLRDLETETTTHQEAAALIRAAEKSRLLIDGKDPATGAPTLVFAHRRVQEYFATQHVQRVPSSVTPAELARNPRWRETAVTLLQVAPIPERAPLLLELFLVLQSQLRDSQDASPDFEWRSETIHALELIVAAYGGSTDTLPVRLEELVTKLVDDACTLGTISDRKFALDCMPVLSADEQPGLINNAFRGTSDWLRLGALRDCASLHPLPSEINTAIRRLLITMLAGGHLRQQSEILDSDLRRLYEGRTFLKTRRLLVAAPIVLVLLCVTHIGYDYLVAGGPFSVIWVRGELISVAFLPFAWFWIFQSTEPLSYGSQARIRRFFGNVMRRAFSWRLEEMETELMALLLSGLVAIVVAVGVVDGVVSLLKGHLTVGVAKISVGVLLDIYLLAWGPTLLVGVHQRWLSPAVHWYEAAAIFRKALPDVRKRLGYARGVATAIVATLVFQAAFIGAILGIFYLLDHLAGSTGHIVVKGVEYLFVILLPAIIVVVLIREIMSWWRVRRHVASRDELTPEHLLETLVSFREPEEAATYLEMLRLGSAERIRTLDRPFVRQLIRLVEESNGAVVTERDGDIDVVLRRALANQLSPVVLTSWKRGVLDELGRIDEFLRER